MQIPAGFEKAASHRILTKCRFLLMDFYSVLKSGPLFLQNRFPRSAFAKSGSPSATRGKPWEAVGPPTGHETDCRRTAESTHGYPAGSSWTVKYVMDVNSQSVRLTRLTSLHH